ncbi:unnamed protein product [Aureobasidium mustum]|uniref:Chromo domain-containing protein n=1 Tax=Aureobasidium mustum TaxID=2773714 RepID=A0A9N8K491_9PEZI|nr:unnamed protein product [Aureobasidium mustum]
MGSSKRKSRQLSEPEEPFYSIRGILKENKTQYLVDWEDIDGQTFEPTWEPKANVTEAAIEEWQEKKQQKKLDEERKKKRKSTDLPASSREVIEIDDDDDDEQQQTPKTTTAPGSKGRIVLKHSKPRPDAAVEVTPPTKLRLDLKRKPGRPRKSNVPNAPSRVRDNDEGEMPLKLSPRPRGRPRKSLPGPDVVRKAKEQDVNGEDIRPGRSSNSSPVQKRTSRTSDQRHKRRKVVHDPLDDDEDDDVPLKNLNLKKRKPSVPANSSDDEPQHAEERPPRPTPAKKRGRPRKVFKGTQPEPPRAEETTASLEGPTESQPLVDAAAASSLSAKNSPYEPGATTSESTFVNSTVNSSSSVHTLPNLLCRRFGVDAVIPDSQSYLDASSVHISAQHIEMDDQMEAFGDASTESQVVIEQVDNQQVVNHEQPIPESSMAQKPEDAPQSDGAATATQSEPSLELSTRNNIATEAASSPIAQALLHLHHLRRLPINQLSRSRSHNPKLIINRPPDLRAQNEAPSEALSPSSARNQEPGQNTLTVQTQATNQKSHVEQAAQQTSFQIQQPSVQQLPLFEFAQSSAEEVTTSSLGFNTQIQPAHQAPAQQASTQPESAQEVFIPSSPIASPPSNLPNTIGASAPSPIRSLSDPEFSGVRTPVSAMSPDTNPDGTPMSTKQKLLAGRARIRAKYGIVTEDEAEKSAPAATSTPVPSRVALDMHSPKPASAVPARLMSPAIAEREVRSPSTVPPVEIIPDETPEEYSRSERYETLLPGQGPQINSETSRPHVSQDLTMNDASIETGPDDNQHLTYKVMIDNFTLHKIWPADSELAQQARDFIVQLHYIVNHIDLNNSGTSSASQMSQSLQADWDMTISTKFRFLKSLLDAAKRHNLHIALLVDPGRLASMLQSFLQGISIMYNVIDGQNNVANQNSTATILLTSVQSINVSPLEFDMIAVLDGSMSSTIIARTQKMLSRDTLVPTISLVIPLSIEHAERCLPSTLSEAERLHILISTATNERLAAGWQSGGTDTDFERKASDIISWVLNPGEADWPFYGLPELQLIEAVSNRFVSQDEHMIDRNGDSNKRHLDNDEAPSAKRVRVEESLPLTINPADMHLTPGTLPVSNSHVSDSVTASQHATTLQDLHRAQAQIRELNQAMETLQYDSEEQRAQMVQAQKERNEALKREERLITTNNDLRAKSTSLRDEVLSLKNQLENARVALVNHTVPERVELEKSKAETLAALVERDSEAKRAKIIESDLAYLSGQYQSRSNENTTLTSANAELEQRIAELEVKASGEQARLRQMNNNAHAKQQSDTIKKLRQDLNEREGTMSRMSEELARLREPRGRVGTRANSAPRSPRAGTREPSSRQGSPSMPRPAHPLSKSTN